MRRAQRGCRVPCVREWRDARRRLRRASADNVLRYVAVDEPVCVEFDVDADVDTADDARDGCGCVLRAKGTASPTRHRAPPSSRRASRVGHTARDGVPFMRRRVCHRRHADGVRCGEGDVVPGVQFGSAPQERRLSAMFVQLRHVHSQHGLCRQRERLRRRWGSCVPNNNVHCEVSNGAACVWCVDGNHVENDACVPNDPACAHETASVCVECGDGRQQTAMNGEGVVC